MKIKLCLEGDTVEDEEHLKRVLAVHDVIFFFDRVFSKLRQDIKYSDDAVKADFAEKVVDFLNAVAQETDFDLNLFRG